MSLQKLSNSDLELELRKLVGQERQLLHLILLHISEVDKRRLYLDRARSSLFEYLVKDLGYSSSAAQRRLEAARLMQEVPVLAQEIKAGHVNLSQIGELSRAVKQKEKEVRLRISSQIKKELLGKIAHKSSFETQKILAQELDLELKPLEKKQVQKDESVHLQISLTKEQYDKLCQCRDLAAHRLLKNNQGLDFSEVIEVLSDAFIGKKAGGERLSAEMITPATATMRINKTLTAKTKKEVLRKHKCCQYTDPTTNRTCGSRFALEVDHLIPQWAEGNHTPKNLTLLCSQHNKHKYRKQAQVRLL